MLCIWTDTYFAVLSMSSSTSCVALLSLAPGCSGHRSMLSHFLFPCQSRALYPEPFVFVIHLIGTLTCLT